MASRVPLASIPALTFYSGALTESRRVSPIPQLKCVGRPCNIFQPDVVRCVNEGGYGTDVDWKCEADLPSSLRFGRVEVSCEGWNGPGDPMVLRGSCGLEYRLVRIPSPLEDQYYVPNSLRSIFTFDNAFKFIFLTLWTALLLFILYYLIKSCLTRPRAPAPARSAPRSSGGGWFPGHHPNTSDDPPPYSHFGKPSATHSADGWTPGFWTGLGLGGLTGSLWGRRGDRYVPPQRYMWDWERPNQWWWGSGTRQAAPPTTSSWFPMGGNATPRRPYTNDRGEGSSNLGSMRRSTGWGGSRVR